MSSTNKPKKNTDPDDTIPLDLMRELQELARGMTSGTLPLKCTTPSAAWIRLECARAGMQMWVVRKGGETGRIVGIVMTKDEGGLMGHTLLARGIKEITFEPITKENIDAIEKEIRRIGGARYLPAEGGVFIGTVAELYGDGE